MKSLALFILTLSAPVLAAFNGLSPVKVIAAVDTSKRVTLATAGSQVSITVTGKVGVFFTLGSAGCRAKDTTATAANQNIYLPTGTTNYVRVKADATCFAVVRANADSAATVRVETGAGAL